MYFLLDGIAGPAMTWVKRMLSYLGNLKQSSHFSYPVGGEE